MTSQTEEDVERLCRLLREIRDELEEVYFELPIRPPQLSAVIDRLDQEVGASERRFIPEASDEALFYSVLGALRGAYYGEVSKLRLSRLINRVEYRLGLPLSGPRA